MSKHTFRLLLAICIVTSCSGTEKSERKVVDDASTNIAVRKLPDNAGVTIEVAPQSVVNLFCVFRHDELKKLSIVSRLDTTIWNSAEVKTKIKKAIVNNSSEPITVVITALIRDQKGNDVNFKYLQLDDPSLSMYILSFENVTRDKPNYTTTIGNSDISLILIGGKSTM